jgi:uncharacterized membrane protein
MTMIDVLTVVAALGSGLVAGFFFSFSFVIMGSLARRPVPEAIAAMNAINVVVLNPWFFTAFFGTALVSLVLAVMALSSALIVAGAAIYIVGCIVVTMMFNVPLNNALAKVDPASDAGAALWARYLRVWTAWNHVRTLAPLVSCALFILALR